MSCRPSPAISERSARTLATLPVLLIAGVLLLALPAVSAANSIQAENAKPG